MVQLYGRNKDGVFQNLDLPFDVSISITKSIEEVEDITQRKSTYSKTFEIPGTSNNDRFFQSVFDVNATNFNNTLQTDCIIQDDGSDLLRGVMRLNKISVSPNGIYYEVYVLEETGSLSTELQQVEICELDYTDIQHDLSYSSITESWNYSGGSYDDYTGIVGKVLYPLAHTGYDLQISYAEWSFGGQGILDVPIKLQQFKPWMNVKYLLDKVFNSTSFTYSSEFFNSQYFKSLFMLMGQSSSSGAALLDEVPENQNLFSVSYGASSFYEYGEPDSSEVSDYRYFIFDEENFDYLNTYTPATVPGYIGNYFTVPVSGQYNFILRQKVINGGIFVPTFIDVVLRDIDSNTNLYVLQDVQIPNSEIITIFANITVTLTQGQRVSMMFQRQLSGEPYNPLFFFREDSLFEILQSPPLVGTLSDVVIIDNLECRTGIDFFKDLVKLFNLTVLPEGEKNFRIEPYNTYLSDTGATTYDWTDKLNLNSQYTIEPLDYSLTQKINFTYQQSEDGLSEYFNNINNRIFGSKLFTKQNNLLTGQLDIEPSFGSLPCFQVGSTGSTMVIPALFKDSQGESSSSEVINALPTVNKTRIGFYCGLVPFYSSSTSTTLSTFLVQSGSTSVGHNYYPAINHLSILTNSKTVPISDLNFQTDANVTFSTITQKPYDSPIYDITSFQEYTPKNIYNQFYKEYIELLYSDEVRLFTGEFILTPQDVVNIQFNDSVVFLNSVWRLYEISDADITDESSVSCKFIKLPFRPSPITLTPPDYEEQKTTRTPSPTPTPTPNMCYSHSCYFGSFGDVCDRTSPITTFYSNCGTIEGGCFVYQDSNCSVPVNSNTYFYPVSSPDLGYVHFVVSGGQVFNVVCL